MIKEICKIVFAVVAVLLMSAGISKADDPVCKDGMCTVMTGCSGGVIMPITIDDDGNVIENPKLGVVGHYVEGDPYLDNIPFCTDFEIMKTIYLGFVCKHEFKVMLDGEGNSDFYVEKSEGVKKLEDAGMSDTAIPVFNCDRKDCAETEFIDDPSRLHESAGRIQALLEASSRVNYLLGGKDKGEINWNK